MGVVCVPRSFWKGVGAFSLLMLAFAAEGARRCDAGGPEESRPAPAASFADLHQDVLVRWTTPFGPGQALAPRAARATAPQFSRLWGVVLVPDQSEIVFVGEREAGYSLLDPDDLFDGLALAWRAGEDKAPGVSMDPRPHQFGGLKSGDELDYVYFGGLAGTEFGRVAAEADRRMKTLSLGKDNEHPERVFRSFVTGHKTQVELALEHPGAAHPWSRFWIEQAEGAVSLSHDGLTILAQATMCVKTQIMTPGKDRLEPAGVAPAPSAAHFAQQLSDHYREYAAAYPEFHQLQAYTQLVNVADALRRLERKNPLLRGRLAALFRGHEVRPVETPTTTEALKVVSPTDPATGRYVEIAGGVTLEPKLTRVLRPHAFTDSLQSDVLAQRQGSRPWTVSSGGRTFQAAAIHRRRPFRMRQEDLRAGAAAVIRDYSPGGAPGEFGRGWSLQAPRLTFSPRQVAYEGFSRRFPETAWYEDERGRTSLPRFTTFALPGKGKTPTFASADGRALLCCYANVFYYLEGNVVFSPEGELLELSPGARVVQFSVSDRTRPLESRHHVVAATTAQTTLRYRHEDDRLVEARDDRGGWIRLAYEQGRCAAATNHLHQKVEYRYHPDGNLQSLHNASGQSIEYQYGPHTGRLVGVQADFGERPADRPLTTQLALTAPTRSEFRQPAEGPLFVEVVAAPDGNGYQLRILGQPVSEGAPRVRRFGQRLQADEALEHLSQSGVLQGRRRVVLVGQPGVAYRLKPAIERRFPDVTVVQADQPETALANLRRQAPAARKATVVLFQEGLEVSEELQTMLKAAAAAGISVIVHGPDGVQRHGPAPVPGERRAVVIVAHHEEHLARGLEELSQDASLWLDCDVYGLTCNFADLREQITDWLQRAGVVSVTGFVQPLEQQLLEPLTAELLRALTTGDIEGAGQPGQQPQDYSTGRILENVIERVKKTGRPAAIPEERLKAHQDQIFEKVGQRRAPILRAPQGAAWQAPLAA